MKLYKTTITIWSEYDTSGIGLETLGREATSGDAICSKQSCVLVKNPEKDKDYECGEFFHDPNDED